MERKRIKDLQEATLMDSSMNFVEDSGDGSGTRRVTYATLKSAINQDGAENLAPAYSNAVTYNVGDLCTYQGKLYSCNTPIGSAEEWTAAHWTATNVGTEVTALKEGLTRAIPHDTASGAVASFTDGADDVPMNSVVVSIDPVQYGSGDPSPTNIRSIYGWVGINFNKCGKNLFDKDSVFIYMMNVYDEEGQPVPSERSGFEYYLPSGTYTIANSGTFVDNICGNVVDNNGDFVSFFRLSTSSSSVAQTITVNDGEYIWIYHNTASDLDLTGTQIQIEYGSTATPYEPYNGTSAYFPLGQTVYSGTLDVVSGVLTVYPYYESYNGETLTGEWISDRDKYAIGATPTTGAKVVDIGGIGTTIQLTPHEVRSLLGGNNIWGDTGDSTVTYWADLTLYIQRKISEALS